MKHSKRIKEIIIVANVFLIFILAACTPASESASPPTKNSPNNPATITDGELEPVLDRYFSAQLTSDAYQDFGKDLFFSAGDVATYRSRVWDAWKTANNGFNEKKLPNEEKMTSSFIGNFFVGGVPSSGYRWTLPALSGEPEFDMWFYYGLSNGSSDASEYPLTLYMHGSGPDREAEWNTALNNLNDGYFDFNDFEYITLPKNLFFIPKGPDGIDYNKWYTQPKQKMFQKLLRLSFLNSKINDNKLFIAGFSEGAYGSQRMASMYADYLAGAIFLSGGEPLKNAPPENLANTYFYISEGSLDTGYDRIIRAREADAALNVLASKHNEYFKHNFWEQQYMGHSDINVPKSMKDLYSKASERNPLPKKVFWEDFEMAGTRRTGFYNLRVLERDTASEAKGLRTYYEMEIINSTNTINLKVQTVDYNGDEYGKNKTYSPSTTGKVRIYLHEKLVDLSQDVFVSVNGGTAKPYTPKLSVKHMADSVALFYDPERVFPAAIDVEIR